MSNLSQKKCQACEGDVKPFEPQESEKLLLEVADWKLLSDSKAIEKEMTFKNFKEALDFTNKVGALAEEEGHHPDILIHQYKKVKITLSTHAIKGLSENDFIMASKIDDL